MIQCKRFTRIACQAHLGVSDDNIADRINEWAIDHPDIRITNIIVSLTDEILVFFEENNKVGDLKYVHETKSFMYSDHGISAYAWVQKYLIKIGRITKEQCE